MPKTVLKLGFQAKEILLFLLSSGEVTQKLENRLKQCKIPFQIISHTVLTSEPGRSQEFLIGGPNFGSETTAELFLWQIIIASHRDDHSFLNL